jgi:hypothetical protein
MRSESILLNDSVRLWVPKRWCQSVPEDQGAVVEKKSLSRSRAFSHVIPSFRSLVAGCFTANHPFVRFSASPLTNRNQRSSSPEGILSGFVRTPTRDQQEIGCRQLHFTNQWSVVHLGRIASPCDGHPDFRSRLNGRFMLGTSGARHGTYSRKLR